MKNHKQLVDLNKSHCCKKQKATHKIEMSYFNTKKFLLNYEKLILITFYKYLIIIIIYKLLLI